ncbi:unnamed protein product [Peniophora sp. CBMAI 1063]|nr:unnamed protein product [Peniophora sp. CBMAI 1063]
MEISNASDGPEDETGPAVAHSHVLAPDNAQTWAAMVSADSFENAGIPVNSTKSDIALRHICRVSTIFSHPQDAESAELTWPHDLPRRETTVPSVATPTHRVILVNEDAHIPAQFRHQTTAPYILQAIQEIHSTFADRPSRTYTPYSRMWRCPYTGCNYIEDLAGLSHSAGEAVCRIAAVSLDSNFLMDDVASEFVTIAGGRYRARREFVRSVVDIIGLRHYETHLADSGLRCWIRGQTPDGQISFMWEHDDLDFVLQSRTIEGWRARRHEELERLSLQSALSTQARRWAHEARFWGKEELVCQRRRARSVHHEYVKGLAVHGIPTGPGLRFSKLRALTHTQSSTILGASRSLHEKVYGSLKESDLDHKELLLRLELAEEVIQDWELGEAWLRTQYQGNSPEQFAH